MLFFRKNRTRKELIEKIKKEELDLSSVFSAINNRAEVDQLFKNLLRRCHPDRFVDNPEKNALAEALFKKVMANSTNLGVLKELEIIIKRDLEP
ncbi:MAG: hypothetical protein J6S97_09910 [Bacteroidales bacterium]|nr:hypothetical protein [Bacteroidales bacterium]